LFLVIAAETSAKVKDRAHLFGTFNKLVKRHLRETTRVIISQIYIYLYVYLTMLKINCSFPYNKVKGHCKVIFGRFGIIPSKTG